MSAIEIALFAYVFVGCIYWFWMAAGWVRISRTIPGLAGDDPPERADWPRLSVIRPARDEAGTIEAATRSLLDEDYPNLQVVLVDDRSTDATGEIIDRLAAKDDRITAIHLAELPDGWLGKVHALHQGVGRAEGDWLLFSDADVHFARGMLRRAVAYADQHGLDHLAAAPDLWTPSFLLDVVVAAFLRTFCVFMRLWAVADPRSKAFVGVGAFNLVRRSAFDRTEGFPWLRLEVADDLGMGLLMKGAGFRSGFVGAAGLVGVQWYRNFADLARGTEKGYASVADCKPVRFVLIGLVFAALELSPAAALLPVGHWGLLPAAVAMFTAATLSIVLAARLSHRRLLPGFFVPLAAAVGLALLVRAAWLGYRRGGAMWRGTLYPGHALREGARVRFP